MPNPPWTNRIVLTSAIIFTGARSQMSFRFITNLRDQTMESFADTGYRPGAWLLSTHRINSTLLTHSETVRDRGAILFADNGTKPLIDLTVNHFRDEQQALRTEIKTLRRSLPDKRRIPKPSELPRDLRQRTSDAAHAVLDFVDKQLTGETVDSIHQRQLLMNPTHMIVKEDYAIACLIALGLEREISGWPVSYFDRRNRITIDFWRQAVELDDTNERRQYATLSAMDYATAKSGARLAALAGVQDVALGFAGINSDPSYARVFRLPYRYHLTGNAPRKYIRTAEILLGIRDGYREAGRHLRAFHALGLGATAQYPLLLRVFDDQTWLSVDATSPVKDAVQDLVYYDERNRGDRLSVVEGASELVAGMPWTFESPFLNQCRDRLGLDIRSAQDWWGDQGQRKIDKADLTPDGPLGRALPVYATGRGSQTAYQQQVRIAHNHWVCDLLAGRAPSSRRAQWADAEIDALIESRSRSTQWGLMAAREIFTRTQVNRG